MFAALDNMSFMPAAHYNIKRRNRNRAVMEEKQTPRECF